MDTKADDALSSLDSKYKNLSTAQLAAEAVKVATMQLMASTEFKKPRLARLAKYQELYDGRLPKKLRQLFNVAIPVFPGMIDTLNAQHDTPIQLKFKEGDAADYFKVQKIQGAFDLEVMSTAKNSKWDSKLRMARKHAIMNGRAILKLTAESDPEYKSELEVVNLKNFHFQPRGGVYLENHLFAGEEDIEKTKSELAEGAKSDLYDKEQVAELFRISNDRDYLPESNQTYGDRLSRFKPMGLDPDNNSYVGETVYRLAQWILNIDGTRYFLVFHPWSMTWLRFEKWSELCSSDLYPWETYATHEDDENFLSKAYADDLFPAADAIVALFNQDLTNREKKNNGARAYDKDMFPDVRKLDEAMFRPDALVPADTKGGTRRIAEGIYHFDVGELAGTVDLISYITESLGKNTGANDMAMGSVSDASKKASVAFAEQKSVSKRLSWASQPFQDMMAGLGKRYMYGLKDHMPSKMAIKLMGENGWDWDQITRLELNTSKDVDVLIQSTDHQMQESEMKKEKREKALMGIGADPLLAPIVSPRKRAEEILRSVGEYDDADIAEFMDIKNQSDKKSNAKAAEAIQLILQGKQPEQWFGATTTFMQKIVDYATDKRATLGPKFDQLLDYAMSHEAIVMQNLERKAMEDARLLQQQATMPGAAPQPQPEASGIPGGVSHAMDIAQLAA